MRVLLLFARIVIVLYAVGFNCSPAHGADPKGALAFIMSGMEKERSAL